MSAFKRYPSDVPCSDPRKHTSVANKFGRYPALLAVAATTVPKYNKQLSHFYSAVFITEQSVTTAADDTADEKVQKQWKNKYGK